MSDNWFAVRCPAPVVMGTGLIALDVVFGLENGAPPRVYAGGTCGNVLAILSYLGWTAYPVARLNGDPAARHVENDLLRWGVRFDLARLTPGARTPVVVQRIRRDASGKQFHRFSLTCPTCGGWLPTYQPVPSEAAVQAAARIDGPAVLFLDRVSRGAVELAETCRDSGALVFFEPSSKRGSPALFRRAIDAAHVVKYSREDANELRPLWPRHAQVPLLIETLGAGGLRYRAPALGVSSWQIVDPYALTRVADTAGAGDWCAAGLAHQIGQRGAEGFAALTPQKLGRAVTFSQALAAWTCAYEGARGGMYVVTKRTFRAGVRRILTHLSHAPGTRRFTGAAGRTTVWIADKLFAELCRVCASKERSVSPM